ncbi:MAG: DUF1987 domain-containing protein [Thiomargarita sp.]|nr:DUF1987 domain-containing protein [Thiomargarita sp.]
MDSLKIEATKCTPEVTFNAENNILEIKGDSYPENITEFFSSVFTWLEEYLGELKNQVFTINIELNYFNSSSSKLLLDIFERLEEEVEKFDKKIIVNWIYDADHDNIEEYGEEFKEDLKSLTFNLVQK